MLTELFFDENQPIGKQPLLSEKRAMSMKEFKSFGGVDKLIEGNDEYKVYLSDRCNTLLKDMLYNLRQ